MNHTQEQRRWLRNYWTLQFVRKLLADGRASLDDAADDLESPWPDSGRWRGSIPRELHADRQIGSTHAAMSRRHSRRGCLQHVWAPLDVAGLQALERRLTDWLERNPRMPGDDDGRAKPSQPTLF